MGQSLTQTGDQRTPFDLFKGLNGDFKFKDFKVSLVVKNSIGADGRVKVNMLKGENVFTKNSVALNATPLNNDIFITSPPFVRDAYTVSEVVLDGGNSNIKTFIENLPQMLDYNLDMEVNPNGNVSLYKDFVFDNSKVDILLKVEAPANFSVGEFVLRDTQAIDLSTVGDVSRIKSAKMEVNISNTFPLGAKLSLTLLDDQMNLLTPLEIDPGDQVITAGLVDGNGYPTQSSDTYFTLGLGRDKIEALKKAKFIGITTTFTGSGQMQKIYDVCSISVSTVIDFEYEVKMGK
jgi:hypothetical protein